MFCILNDPPLKPSYHGWFSVPVAKPWVHTTQAWQSLAHILGLSCLKCKWQCGCKGPRQSLMFHTVWCPLVWTRSKWRAGYKSDFRSGAARKTTLDKCISGERKWSGIWTYKSIISRSSRQAQTQIFVTGSKFCDLVVWTQKDCVVVWIIPDVDFWTTLLTKAQELLLNVSLPELVACYYTRTASQQSVLNL